MPNRFVCSVLDEMRDCIKTLRFDRMKGLIEEAQTLVNRMEARIHDMNDHEFNRYRENIRTLKKEIRDLKQQKYNLQNDIEDIKQVKEEKENDRQD